MDTITLESVKRVLLLLITISLFALKAHSQAKSDAGTYYMLGLSRLQAKPDSAFFFFSVAEYLATEQKDTAGLQLAYDGIGQYFMHMRIMDSAFVFLNNSKKICGTFYGTQNKEYAIALNNLARFYHLNKQTNTALVYYDSVVYLYHDVLQLGNTADYAQILANRSALLIETNRMQQAVSEAIKSNYIVKAIYSESSFEFANSCYNLGAVSFKAGNSVLAEKQMIKAITILEKLKYDESLLYAKMKNSQGLIYQDLGKWKVAENSYLKAQIAIKKINQTNSIFSAIVHQNIARLYTKMANYPLAIKSFTNCKTIFKINHATSSVEYIDILNNEAIMFDDMDQHHKSGPLYHRAMELTKKYYNPQDQQYAIQHNNLSAYYGHIANKDSAIATMNVAMQSAKKAFGKKHPTYAKFLMNYGHLLGELGSYPKAEKKYLQGLEIYKLNNLEKSLVYADGLDQMARHYERKDQFENAIDFFDQAITLKKKIVGKEHPSYLGTIHNKANLLVRTGQLAKADELYLKTLEVYDRIYPNSPTLAAVQGNLAQLYYKVEWYERAKNIMLPAIANTKNSLGAAHPTYGKLIGNLALIYLKQDSLELATPLFLESLEISKKHYGDHHPDVALGVNSIAYIHLIHKEYDLAEKMFLQALSSFEQSLGKKHGTYGEILNNIIMLYAEKKDFNRAAQYALQSSEQLKNKIDELFRFAGEDEKKAFVDVQIPRQELLQKIALQSQNNKLIEIGLNNQLMLKGLVLSQSKNILSKLESIDDEKIQNTLSEFRLLKKKIAAAKQNNSAQLEIKILSEQALKTENAIVKIYNKRFNEQDPLNRNWRDIQKKIEPNEVAIEFSHFRDQGLKRKKTKSYIAYIIRKDSKHPQLVSLFEESELINILENNEPNMLFALRGSIAKNRNLNNRPSQKLHDIIWNPIKKQLTQIEKIYYSPTGLLNKIPFAALPVETGKTLCQKYKLEQKSNLNILTSNKQITPAKNITLFGNVNYEENISVDHGTKAYWKALPGTLSEINSIKKIGEQNSVSTKIYQNKNASEKEFKDLNKQAPYIIHLATHGYFYQKESSENNIYAQNKDPLLRSGLILSGGNRFWPNGNSEEYTENGILTAIEISSMNLKGTKLVVLSACETALGDIKGSEGVYGLQRAFKMAGAEKIIMSLWKVPDEPTAKFMKILYSYWLNDKIKLEEAFRKTQLAMQAKEHKPLDWAGFVLVE